jgi:hypothetical protein
VFEQFGEERYEPAANEACAKNEKKKKKKETYIPKRIRYRGL